MPEGTLHTMYLVISSPLASTTVPPAQSKSHDTVEHCDQKHLHASVHASMVYR